METANLPFPWIELIDRPAFCVQNGIVTVANTAAKNRFITAGTDISQIVTGHRQAYDEFQSGCLYLSITVNGLPCDASVKRTQDYDVFVLAQENDQLQSLALAAQHLRIPLANLMTVSDRLLSTLEENDAIAQQYAGQMNHALFQLLRIVSNMSDANSKLTVTHSNTHTVDMTAVFNEFIERASVYYKQSGVQLVYSGPGAPILSLANPEMLERAVYNLLSNALKFSPANCTVNVKLSRSGNMLSFVICNTTENPISESSFWNSYRREPSIADNRHGLGLGLSLVCAASSTHGGTVLIDHPEQTQTRVTMTMAIRTDTSGIVRSPTVSLGDYAGGRDKGLLEFAEVLPSELYRNIN